MKAVALLAAVATVVVLLVRDEPTYPVTLTVAGARGLVPGAEVRAGGEKVGTVRSVALDDAGMPRVRLAVHTSYRLRRGARAAVRLQSLSGEFNRYVALTQGSGARLSSPVRLRASAPVELDHALEALAPSVRADVRAGLDGMRRSVAGRGPDVQRTLAGSASALRSVAAAAGDVNADGNALRSLVTETRAITSSLASRPAELTRSAEAVADLLGVTARRDGDLAAALRRLPEALDEPRRALRDARAATGTLRGLVRDLKSASGQLADTAVELRAAVDGAAPVVHDVAGLAGDAPGQLRALTPLIREAAPILEQLQPVLKQAGPMLDQTRVRLPDAWSFFANWADFTSNYDANGHGARVGIVLPPASTRTLKPWENRAGQLAPPYLRTPGSLEDEPWTDYADSFVAGGEKAADAK
jgi:phospholipid/cholesterol/gamma-HCH transport system substrate-binding protein